MNLSAESDDPGEGMLFDAVGRAAPPVHHCSGARQIISKSIEKLEFLDTIIVAFQYRWHRWNSTSTAGGYDEYFEWECGKLEISPTVHDEFHIGLHRWIVHVDTFDMRSESWENLKKNLEKKEKKIKK